ncbi:MAG: glycoside hydrolase, partial [Pedobacter sp.]
PNAPQQLVADALEDGVNLKWIKPLKASDGETAFGYVIYRFEEGEKINTLNPKNILHVSFEDFTFYLDTTVEKGKRYNYLVTALDRLKNESEASGPVGVQAK